MTTLSSRPMRLFVVEFNELYARHLCRHSQVGINVIHLATLANVWYGVYGLLAWITEAGWFLALPMGLYLAVLAPNLPGRTLAATALFAAIVLAAVLLLPQPPSWFFLILIVVSYKIQSWSHRFYVIATDMTEFNKKYAKGALLFVVLLLYEVPIVLQFLLFAPKTRSQAAPKLTMAP